MKLTSSSIRIASRSPIPNQVDRRQAAIAAAAAPEKLRERLLALREGSRFLEAVKST